MVSTEPSTLRQQQGNGFSQPIATAATVFAECPEQAAHDAVYTSPSVRSTSTDAEPKGANTSTVPDTHPPHSSACQEQDDAHAERGMSESETYTLTEGSRCTLPVLQHTSAEQHVEPRTRDRPVEIHTAPIDSSDKVQPVYGSSEHTMLALMTPTPAQTSENASRDKGDAQVYKLTALSDIVSDADGSQAADHTTQGYDVNHAAGSQSNQSIAENSTKPRATNNEDARRTSTASVHSVSAAAGHAKSEDNRETIAAAGAKSDTESVRIRSFAPLELRGSLREARRRSSNIDAEEMWAMRDRCGDVCR